jgi:hypothetical protein
MHLFAVMKNETAWKSEQGEVAAWIKRQKEDRDALQGTFDYILGVGNKRFMWALRREEGSSARLQYAKEACKYLSDLRRHVEVGALATKILNLYDNISEDRAKLELEAAELDAYVWVKPAEAVERARHLLPDAQRLYPSVIHKLTDTIDLGEYLHKRRPCRWRFGKSKKQ